MFQCVLCSIILVNFVSLGKVNLKNKIQKFKHNEFYEIFK